jgi:hypothetical protein
MCRHAGWYGSGCPKMRAGTRHLLGVSVGIAAAGAVTLLLIGGEYEASLTQDWALAQAAHGYSAVSMVNGPVSSARAALLILLAAVTVGAACARRWPSPTGPLAAGLALAGLGVLTWLDTWRAAQLFGGSLGPAWSGLVTDQVFGVLGSVLLIAGAAGGRLAAGGRGLAIIAGIIAIPVAWYLVQLTNLTVVNYVGSYWWPFRQSAGAAIDAVFILLIACLSILVAVRGLGLAAVIAGAPMVALGALGLLAPDLARELLAASGLPVTWRSAILLDVTSGLPLLYGGVLMSSGLLRAPRPRAAPAPGKARNARPARLVELMRQGWPGRAEQG